MYVQLRGIMDPQYTSNNVASSVKKNSIWAKSKRKSKRKESRCYRINGVKLYFALITCDYKMTTNWLQTDLALVVSAARFMWTAPVWRRRFLDLETSFPTRLRSASQFPFSSTMGKASELRRPNQHGNGVRPILAMSYDWNAFLESLSDCGPSNGRTNKLSWLRYVGATKNYFVITLRNAQYEDEMVNGHHQISPHDEDGCRRNPLLNPLKVMRYDVSPFCVRSPYPQDDMSLWYCFHRIAHAVLWVNVKVKHNSNAMTKITKW